MTEKLLYYKKIGEGKPLLILHGLFGLGDNWNTLAKQYADNGFVVYLIDQRNHGRSFHSYEWNYEIMADDLVRLIDHENIDKADLIGHSMGGKTAMFFAKDYQSRIHKLIIADIAPRYYTPHHQSILAALNSFRPEEITSRKEAEDILRAAIRDEGTIQFLLKNLYWTEEGKLGWRFGLREIESNIETVGEALPADTKIETPTLFIKGEHSGYVNIEDELEIKRMFTKVRFETVTNAGHWLHAENPTDFIKKTLAFLI